jgi:Putative Ig domain
MSNSDILASGSSSGRSGDHDSLAKLLDRGELAPARKIGPVRDVAHGAGLSGDDYDLTNPNLHHGSQSDGRADVPIQEQSGSPASYPVDIASSSIGGSLNLAAGNGGPTTIADQNANADQVFALDVSGHFAAPIGGGALTFSANLPAGLHIDPQSGIISGTATDSDFGNDTITVTATNAQGHAISESFILAPADSGPTATPIADQSANEGQAFSLNVSSHFAAPAAGDALTFSATLPTGLHIDPHSGIISGTPTDSDFGNNTITVTATDAHGKAISENFHLAVGDTGPTATPIANQSANEGQAFGVNVSGHFAAPASGDTLTFSATLPAGLHIDPHSGIISGTPTDSDFGNNTITVTAIDAHGKAISESFRLAVGDTGPTATPIVDQNANEGHAFSLDVSGHFAAPAAGDTLTFSATLPTGLHIDPHSGVISGTPTDSDFGNHSITVTATDAHGKAISESFHLAVGDTGPTATPIVDQNANEGHGFSLNVSGHFAAPASGDTLTFSATLPAGLHIDPHSGIISGTPTDSDFGNNTITVTATDAHGKTISESFHLAVGDTGPTATPITNQSANEGQAFSLNVSSHFTVPAAGDTLTFSATLPAGLHIDPHSGIISGTPTDGDFGNNTITVTATDAHGKAISESFRLAVGDTGPTATPIANQSANEGQAFNLNVSSHFAAPAAGDTLTFSATLPTGLHIDPHSGVISGTPTDSDFGNRSITVTATDAHGKAISESFHLAVGDTGPTATPIVDQNANEGHAFSLDVSGHFAAPAAGDALTFSAALPTGLHIDPHTGLISGTPTDSDFGNHSITVTATDAHGKVISESFHLAVGDTGPTATPIADQSANEGHSFSLNAGSHFAAPAFGDALTFSAALPTGLHIDPHTGIIAGTPTNGDVGNNPITVTATDAHGHAIGETFNLAVSDNNHTFFIGPHSGNIAITGSSSWTDTIDLHNIGPNASFNVTEFAADGHVVQSWTGLVADGSAQSDHSLSLTQGDHAAITVNHTDGSAADHIAVQSIDHMKY